MIDILIVSGGVLLVLLILVGRFLLMGFLVPSRIRRARSLL